MNIEIFKKLSKSIQTSSDNLIQQKEILDYFQSLKLNPIGWKLCAETLLLNEIETNLDEMGIFFCFQIIEDYIKTRYNNDTDDERSILKQFILTLFDRNIIITNYLQNKYAHLVNTLFLLDFPQQKWPTFFQDFLSRCNIQLKCELFLRILIQINIDIADREIPKTTKEMQRNTLIKDMMRESSCLIDLAKFWFNIIQTYHSNCPQIIYLCLDIIGAYISWIDINLITNDSIMPILFMLFENKQYRCSVVECFNCILKKGMDPLAKTQLIEAFLNFDLIKKTLIEIFTNQNENDNDNNLEFIEKFASLINTIGIELIEALKKIRAKNNIDQQLQQTSIIISEAIESKFQLLCQFLSYSNLQISMRIHSFTRDYIQWLKLNIKDTTTDDINNTVANNNATTLKFEEQIKTLITIIIDQHKRLCETVQKNGFNSDNEEFLNEYRKSSKTLFENLLLIKPMIIIDFICNQLIIPTLMNLNQLQPQQQQLQYSQVECSLYYFYLIGENLNLINNVNENLLERMIELLITSSISMYSNYQIQTLYFDLIIRYEKFFFSNPNLNHLLIQIIISFLDDRGLRNVNEKIRSKVCKLFNKFIKIYINRSKNNENKQYSMIINDVLKRIEDFLLLDIVYDSIDLLIEQDLDHLCQSTYLIKIEQITYQYPLSTNDQLQIYEIFVFLIISNNNYNLQQKYELIQNLFQKIWNKYQEYQDECSKIDSYLSNLCQNNNVTNHINLKGMERNQLIEKRTITHYHMSHLIDLISATSKSFSTVNTIKTIGVQKLYLYSFELFLKSIATSTTVAANDLTAKEAIIDQQLIQSSIRLLLHRLIVCLDDNEMIPMLPNSIQTLFLSSTIMEINGKSIQELIPLFNQIIPKYKHSWLFQRDISPFLDRIFSPLIHLYYRLIIETVNNDNEKLSLQKSYYSYLHLLTVQGLIPNFFDIEQQLIEKIITSLIEGIVHSPDTSIQRVCCQVMANIIDIYINDMTMADKQNRSINQYFVRFTYDQLIIACLICIEKNCSDDFTTSQDAISLLRKLQTLIGHEQMAAYLRQEIIPKYFNNNIITNNNINNNINDHQLNCNNNMNNNHINSNNNNNDDIVEMLLSLDMKQYRKRIRHAFQQFKKMI